MKTKLLSMVAISLFIVSSAFAGKGGPIITGYWEGAGQAMYVDGTTAEITLVTADLYQEGSFISGTAQFTVVVGENDPETQAGQMSAHISGNAINGVLGGCITTAPDCVGAGVFEGKIKGKKMTGTIIDLSDGSTSVVTLKKMSD